jgi:hypothetical protein
MTKILWCRALPWRLLVCVAIAGCGDDGGSGGDTAATEGGDSGDETTGGGATESGGTTEAGGTSESGGTTAPGGATESGGTTESGGADESSDDAGSSTGGEPLEIIGAWVEVFPGGAGMQTHTISEESWAIASEFGDSLHHIDSWDARARVLVAQSDESNAFNPGLWGKFEWLYDGGTLYYCQSVYDAETSDAAWSAPGAEPSDLDAGCGGFPWSPLEPA